MHLVVQHDCQSTGDPRVYSLTDTFVEGEHLVGNCFGKLERLAISTISKAVHMATGEAVDILDLISKGLIQTR